MSLVETYLQGPESIVGRLSSVGVDTKPHQIEALFKKYSQPLTDSHSQSTYDPGIKGFELSIIAAEILVGLKHHEMIPLIARTDESGVVQSGYSPRPININRPHNCEDPRGQISEGLYRSFRLGLWRVLKRSVLVDYVGSRVTRDVTLIASSRETGNMLLGQIIDRDTVHPAFETGLYGAHDEFATLQSYAVFPKEQGLEILRKAG